MDNCIVCHCNVLDENNIWIITLCCQKQVIHFACLLEWSSSGDQPTRCLACRQPIIALDIPNSLTTDMYQRRLIAMILCYAVFKNFAYRNVLAWLEWQNLDKLLNNLQQIKNGVSKTINGAPWGLIYYPELQERVKNIVELLEKHLQALQYATLVGDGKMRLSLDIPCELKDLVKRLAEITFYLADSTTLIAALSRAMLPGNIPPSLPNPLLTALKRYEEEIRAGRIVPSAELMKELPMGAFLRPAPPLIRLGLAEQFSSRTIPMNLLLAAILNYSFKSINLIEPNIRAIHENENENKKNSYTYLLDLAHCEDWLRARELEKGKPPQPANYYSDFCIEDANKRLSAWVEAEMRDRDWMVKAEPSLHFINALLFVLLLILPRFYNVNLEREPKTKYIIRALISIVWLSIQFPGVDLGKRSPEISFYLGLFSTYLPILLAIERITSSLSYVYEKQNHTYIRFIVGVVWALIVFFLPHF